MAIIEQCSDARKIGGLLLKFCNKLSEYLNEKESSKYHDIDNTLLVRYVRISTNEQRHFGINLFLIVSFMCYQCTNHVLYYSLFNHETITTLNRIWALLSNSGMIIYINGPARKLMVPQCSLQGFGNCYC